MCFLLHAPPPFSLDSKFTSLLSPHPTPTHLFPSLFPSYSQLIAEWPVAVLLVCLAVILLCTLAGLLGSQLPDFSNPLLVRGQEEGEGPQAWPLKLSLGTKLTQLG